MGYKYFEEGLKGEAGRRAEIRQQQESDEGLAQVFRMPLQHEICSREDSLPPRIPERAFHIVNIDQRVIKSRDQIAEFARIIESIPHSIDLILNMSQSVSVGSEAIGKLVVLRKQLQENGHMLHVVTQQKNVIGKLGNMRLDTMLGLKPSTEEAFQNIYDAAA